ncbi:MAG TPA: hypothetical protein VLG76_06175 [Rhabdochlamydiaceae bacterium]|nr:hypothetical protein [Rhabdochlamydiaceae bacterium]
MVDNRKAPWGEAFEQLKALLQKEVALMREILANFHQEEFSLLMNERETWTKVIEQRSDMIVTLMGLRHDRARATKELQELAKEKLKKTTISFQELFSQEDVVSGEILSLLDQILALVQKLNLQNCRNEFLFYEVRNSNELPLHCPYPPPAPAQQPKRAKTTVATYPPPPQKNN